MSCEDSSSQDVKLLARSCKDSQSADLRMNFPLFLDMCSTLLPRALRARSVLGCASDYTSCRLVRWVELSGLQPLVGLCSNLYLSRSPSGAEARAWVGVGPKRTRG
jgi:hypothetical protein